MSKNLKYQAFLITVAARGGVPAAIAHKIVDLLGAKTEELDYGLEETKAGEPHLHVLCLWKKSVERHNLKKAVLTVVTKFIALPDVKRGVDIRVVTDAQTVRDYVAKETECSHEFPLLFAYVEKNFGVAEEIIARNAEYNNNQIRYAYDNFETWKTELDWTQTGPDLWAQYQYLRHLHAGKGPTTQWKLEDIFKSICVRMNYITKDDEKKFVPQFLRE